MTYELHCTLCKRLFKTGLTGYDQFIRIRSLPFVIPIAQTGLMGSIYCTMALTLVPIL